MAIIAYGLTATPGPGYIDLQWAMIDTDLPAQTYFDLRGQIWASQENDLDTATNVGQGLTSFRHSGLGRDATWYYWVRSADLDSPPNVGDYFPTSPTGGVNETSLPFSSAAETGASFTLVSGRLQNSVDVDGNLTIFVTTIAGLDPSPEDPVFVAFRNETTGLPIYATIEQRTEVTVPAGSYMGLNNIPPPNTGTPFRLWGMMIRDADTEDYRLGVINCVDLIAGIDGSTTDIFGLPDSGLITTSEAPVSLAGVVLTDIGVTTPSPFVLIGFLDWTNGFFENAIYDVEADRALLYGIGMARPGWVVKSWTDYVPDQSDGYSTATPFDNTIPQDSETAEIYQWDPITPTEIGNVLSFDVTLNFSTTVDTNLVACLHSSAFSSAFGVAANYCAAGKLAQVRVRGKIRIEDLGPLTFSVAVGTQSGGTVSINGVDGGTLLWGFQFNSVFKIEELKG